MKKILSLLVIFALAASMLVSTAFAAGTAIYVESANAKAGEEVTIDVSISGNTGFAAAKVQLVYDSSVLTLKSITPVLLAGGAAACALSVYVLPIGFYAACAGALINIAQLCCDRLYASPDAFSPGLYDVLMALLAAAGLIMSGGNTVLMPAMCLPAALAGCMLLFGMRRGMKLRPGFRVLGSAPAAVLKNWLFPGLITAAVFAAGADSRLIAAALISCALLEWLEPNFRRTSAESSAASLAACAFAIIALAAAAILPPAVHGRISPDSAAIYTDLMLAVLLAAAFGALTVGTHIGLRRIGMLLVMLAEMAFAVQYQFTGIDLFEYWRWINAGGAVIIAALSVPDAREVMIHARARKRRRK